MGEGGKQKAADETTFQLNLRKRNGPCRGTGLGHEHLYRYSDAKRMVHSGHKIRAESQGMS